MAQRELDLVLEEARAGIAAGRMPDGDRLRARLRASGAGEAELKQLERVLTIARARTRLAREVAPAAPAPSLRSALKTKPTINANMDVRREPGFVLRWESVPSIVGWEVRISERPDARSDYVVRETRELPAGETQVAVPVSETPLRVHILGRTRDGRLVRRAVISALTEANWNDRWQQRASAS